MSRNSRSDDSGLGCVMVLLLAIVAMPFVGLYLLLTAKEEGQRILGIALIIVGIAVWIKSGL